MKKGLCLIFILSISILKLFSQDTVVFKKNAISINAPAFTRLFSINYERVFSRKNWKKTGNIGFYYLPIDESTKNVSAIFGGIDFIGGKKKHFIDIGANFMFDRQIKYYKKWENGKIPYLLGVTFIPKIGYHHQLKNNRFFYRILVMPFLLDITPRSSKEQLNNSYFNFREISIDLVSFGLGYSF